MATITANISASDTVIPTSEELEIGHYTIDSENIYVTGNSRGQDGRAFDRLFASVNRAVGGSTAASHTSGATLTRYYPDAATSGASGVPDPSGGDDGDVPTVESGAYVLAPPSGGVATVFTSTTTLTDAQIKALPTTPIELVPAQGAGKLIMFYSGFVVVDAQGDAYGNVGAGGLEMRFASGEALEIVDATNTEALLTSFGIQGTYIAPEVNAPLGVSDMPNQPLLLDTDNVGDFTGGDAANFMKVTVLYTVLDL